MPQITIQKGDTLSKIAQQYGTSVAELVNSNRGNTSVKSADLIIAGGNLNVPDRVALPPQGPAPSAQSSAGALDTDPLANQGSRNAGDLTNFTIALRSALTEAAQVQAAERMRSLAPFMEEGTAPNAIGAAIGLAQSGLRQKEEDVFSDISGIFQDRQNFALQLAGRYPDSGILPSDAPETAARKASRAPSFLKSFKGEPTVAEKEQGEARVSQAELERKRGEEGFVDLNEYRKMKARSLLSPQEFDRRFTYFLSDGNQERIRSENASPTTRTANDFTKGEQLMQDNVAIIDRVGQGNLNQFVAQLHSVIQQETNLTESEINQLLARYGFAKMGNVWVYQRPK